MSYSVGISVFYSDPNEPVLKDQHCSACNTELKGEKQTGYHSFATAMAKIESTHWVYYCPNVDKEKHEELVKLVKEIDHLISEDLKKIVNKELQKKQKAFRKTL